MGTLFKGWARGEIIWLATALGIVGYSSYGGSWLDFATAMTNVICVILVAKGRVSNYYWGLAGVLLYGYMAYAAGLYGNMGLNLLYYAPMQFIGYYQWRKQTSVTDETDVAVRRLSLFEASMISGIILSSTAVLTVVFSNFTDNTNPLMDSFTTVASMVAMYLMVRRYSEQWIIWIIINIVSIYMWYSVASETGEGYGLVGMWTVLLLNAMFGAYKWFIVQRNK